MARLPRIPSLKRGKKKEETERQRKLRILGQTVMRFTIFFMGAVALIYGGITILLGSSLFIPRSADGVLDSVKEPSSYTWNSQSVRLVKLGGRELEQHAARGAIVDLGRNKFQASIVGVLPERAYYVSDGKYTIRLTDVGQESGQGWEKVTDVCNEAPSISAETLAMPTVEEIKAGDPEIATDEGTIFGERAWVLNFEATPEIVERLLWLPFFDQALKATPEEMPWVISEEEREKINNGQFKTVSGELWVNREGERRLQQIDLKIEIEEGSRYRFLAQNVIAESENSLAELDLGPADC